MCLVHAASVGLAFVAPGWLAIYTVRMLGAAAEVAGLGFGHAFPGCNLGVGSIGKVQKDGTRSS